MADPECDTSVRRVTTLDPSGAPPGEAALLACRDIIDAASALSLDLEFLAGDAEAELKHLAVEDARRSIERIVKLAERIRTTPPRRRIAEGEGR
jgi:hypothetical protein